MCVKNYQKVFNNLKANMKGAVYAFAIVALLIGVQAYEGIEPVSEPTSEAVYSALFSTANVGQRIKSINPAIVQEDAACVQTYMEEDIKILESFGQGIRQCFHITAEEFQALFNSKVYGHVASQTKAQMAQCKQNSASVDAELDCYAETISNYFSKVNKMSSPYLQVSKACLKMELKQLERQWSQIFNQMTQCFAQVAAENAEPSVPASPENPVDEIKSKLQGLMN